MSIEHAWPLKSVKQMEATQFPRNPRFRALNHTIAKLIQVRSGVIRTKSCELRLWRELGFCSEGGEWIGGEGAGRTYRRRSRISGLSPASPHSLRPRRWEQRKSRSRRETEAGPDRARRRRRRMEVWRGGRARAEGESGRPKFTTRRKRKGVWGTLWIVLEGVD